MIGKTAKVSLVDQSRDELANTKTVFEDVTGGADMLSVGRFEMPSRAYLGRFNFKGATSKRSSATCPVVNAAACTWPRPC